MTNFGHFLDRAKNSNVVPVIDTMPADLLTPLGVYLKLANGEANSFLFESVAGGENLARYSFIGAGPEMIVRGNQTTTLVHTADGCQTYSQPVIDYVRCHFKEHFSVQDDSLPSFVGGAIGVLDFDCIEWFEPSLRGEQDSGSAEFMFFRSVVAFDHARQVVNIVTLVFTDESEDLRSLYDSAVAKNAALKRQLNEQPIILPDNGGGTRGETISNFDKSDFEDSVVSIKDLIAAGECYQVVLSQAFERPTDASAVAIYRAIRSLNPSPYMILLQSELRSIIGASPEMLVRCRGNKLEYRPIAGTRPRGQGIDEDTRLAAEMLADPKEVAEHAMLVDLGRNDLGRVAEYGSVEVSEMLTVEKYSHVQHLVSSLNAKLRSGLDRFDALSSCFPAGTVSGAPKVRAVEIIRALEPTPRETYAGAVGYFDYAGNMDTCIAIRTMTLKNGVARVQAGAGIVADSVPEKEYEETVNKAKAMLRAIDIAEGVDQ